MSRLWRFVLLGGNVQGNLGVTRAKSFVFGVTGGSTPTRSGDPVIGSSGDRKGRRLPRLNLDVCGSRKGNSSAFPCLRGELNACFSTQLHRDAQVEKGGMSSYNRETRARSQKLGARS